ncbi:MAG: SGNH/GDSL hydrolase family protein [Prevotella sp.]
MAKRFLFLALWALLVCTGAVSAQVRPTVAILGDSYSTFEGYIYPDTNESWYFVKNNPKHTDLNDVRDTWWWRVVKEGGYKLGVNNSCSGATICYTGYNDADYSPRSFITRLPQLGTPDIILIFGGTNDSWAGAQMGEYKYGDWKLADLYFFRPAMAKLLDDAQKRYPNARVLFLLNSELREEVNSSVRTICKHYGVSLLELKDVDKLAGHPTVKGMESISRQVLKALQQ